MSTPSVEDQDDSVKIWPEVWTKHKSELAVGSIWVAADKTPWVWDGVVWQYIKGAAGSKATIEDAKAYKELYLSKVKKTDTILHPNTIPHPESSSVAPPIHDPLSSAKAQLKWSGEALKIANKLVGYTKNNGAVWFIMDRAMKLLEVPSSLDKAPVNPACEKVSMMMNGYKRTCLLVAGHKGAHFDPNWITAWDDGGKVLWDFQTSHLKQNPLPATPGWVKELVQKTVTEFEGELGLKPKDDDVPF